MSRRPSPRRPATKRLLVALTVLLVVALEPGAWVRLHTSQGVPLSWPAGQLPLTFVLNDQGSADVPGDGDDRDLRRAFDAWQDLPDSAVRFKEVTSAAQRKRTDWESDDIHLVLFDDGSAGIPWSSGVLAITPVEFQVADGRIVDADILFNDTSFGFSTTLQPGTFDLRAVATHEIGHFIGLDHSQVGGATMAPFTTSAAPSPRTLEADDAAAAAALYPDGPKGRITGTVTRAGQKLDGAHVWARSADDGRVASGTYSVDGAYTLTGLEPGPWIVTAAPVGEPLSPGDIHNSAAAAGVVDGFATDFGAVSVGPVVVTGSAVVNAPPLFAGPNVVPRADGPSSSLRVARGEAVSLPFTVTAASQIVEAQVPGDGVTVTDTTTFANVQVEVDLEVATDAPLGLYDLELLEADGDRTVFAGFLEVVPPAMTLSGLEPGCTSASGGALVTVAGAHLDDVVDVQVDGESLVPEALDADADLLSFVAPPRAAGLSTVTLVDVSGDAEQLTLVYVDAAQPEITSLFPDVGAAVGGQLLVLMGSGFDGDTEVTIGGVPASSVTVSSERIELLSPFLPGTGPQDVVVRSPACDDLVDVLPGGFEAVPGFDPVVFGVTPRYVDRAGGEVITVFGQQFANGSVVELFTDLDTGEGGTLLDTTWLFTTKLDADTPPGPLPVGEADLVVRRPDGAVGLAPDALRVVPVLTNGVRLDGTLNGSPDDAVVAFLDGLAGTEATITATRRGKGDLVPEILLTTPGFELVSSSPDSPFSIPDVSQTTKRSARLRRYVLPTTGRYTIEVVGNVPGDVRLTVKERPDPASKRLRLSKKDGVVLGPDTFEAPVDAKAGTLVSGTFQGSKKEGLRPTLEITGPDGLVVAVDDEGAITGLPEAVDAVSVLSDGRRLRLRKLPLPSFGAYTVALGAAGETSGVVTGSFSFRAPKAKGKLVEGE